MALRFLFCLLASACARAPTPVQAGENPHLRILRGAPDGSRQPDLARIHGRIQFVEHFPDFRVAIDTAFADLDICRVTSFADGPGEWQIVDHFPDYRIQIVEAFPDFTIRWVD